MTKYASPQNLALVDKYLGTAYDVVKKVHDNIENINLVADNLELARGPQGIAGYTPVLGVDFEHGPRGDLVTYVYKNATSLPSKPLGGFYDGTTEASPTGWQLAPSLPGENETTWVSTTRWSYDSDALYWYQNGWSDPSRFSGVSGVTPVKGTDYFDGVAGSFVSFIYRNAETKPLDPVDGSYDGASEVVPIGWTDEQVSPTPDEFVWVSTTRYSFNGAFWIKSGWSTPSKFSGASGYSPVLGVDYSDGQDGIYTSFIFRNSAVKPNKPLLTDGSYDGDLETYPIGWSDDPVAPSSGVFIWITKRNYKKVGTDWIGSDWSEPAQFSGDDGYTPVVGVDFFNGLDGQYTSYVFKNATAIPVKPTGGSFDGTNEIIPSGYTDDPTTPPTGEFTWVSQAMYVHDGTDWNHTGWSIPSRFSGEKGEDGEQGIQGPTGGAGIRGSKRYYRTITTSAWSTTQADLAISTSGDTKLDWDIVTLSNATTGFTETRYWLNAVWTILNEVIDGNLLVDGSIVAGKIATGSIVAGDIAADTITASQIASGAVTANEISAGAVTATKLSSGEIITTTAQIKNGIISNAKIANAAITNAKIGSAAITSAKIADLNVSTVKIAGNAVTVTASSFAENVSVGPYTTLYSLAYNHLYTSSVDVIIFFSIKGAYTGGGSAGIGEELLLQLNGTTIKTLPTPVSGSSPYDFDYVFTISVPTGNNTFRLHCPHNKNSGFDESYLVILGTKK